MADSTVSAADCLVECRSHQEKFPDVAVMQPSELKRLLADKAPLTLLDCRTAAERAVSTLPGAISPDELKRGAGDSSAEAGPIVVYCTVGYRSSLEARRLAAESGRRDVFSMSGILPWAHEGGELVDPETNLPTRRLHCFGSKWAGMAPADCETIIYPPVAGVRAVLPTVWAVVKDTVTGWIWGRQPTVVVP